MAKLSFEVSGSNAEEKLPICMGKNESAHLKSSSTIEVPTTTVFVVVLTAICFISINNYFCYHEPSAIALQFEEFYNLSTKQFGTLFTIYSAPNVILVFFSGQFIDRFGLQRSSLVFNGLILISMLLAAILPSPQDPNTSLTTSQIYVLLLISRLVLGLGGESICACVSTMISRWFSSTKYLNTAMALNQASVQLFGSAAAFYILPHVEAISSAQWITVTVCLISLVANLCYNYFDTVYQEYLVDVNEVKDEDLLHGTAAVTVTGCETSSSTVTVNSSYYQSVQTKEEEEYADVETSFSSPASISNNPVSWNPMKDNEEVGGESVLSQSILVLKKFPVLFWLLLLHISLVSPILYTFTAFGPMYLQETFPSTSSATEAGDAISLLYMSIVAAPFTGMAIDYIGYRSYIQFFASCNIPFLFILLTYGLLDPKLCMIWMGVIFSITESNGMALISLTVPSELTGTAFGLYACCISIALLLEPASVGYIREWTGSFALSIWIFTGLTLLGSIVALLVIVYDRWHENLISKSA
jgi:MFS family permease